MSHIDPIRQRVLRIAEPVCTAAGYEVVDVRFKSEPGGWVLRVYVDVPPAEDAPPLDLSVVPEDLVDLADCERLSRELSAVLDVEDPIPHNYSLEVSSPGIDRPLRTAGHFRRYVGADVRIAMGVPLGERRNFKGRLTAVEATDAGDVAVVDVDGQPFRLRIEDIDTARIVPDWDAVLKGGSGVGPAPAGARLPKATHPKAKESAGRRDKR
jgi:ribosome maturation factor RimP